MSPRGSMQALDRRAGTRQPGRRPLLLLASASPRRRALLALTGWPAVTELVAVDESERPGESPEALARRLAQTKARDGLRRDGGADLVLAADTVVAIDGDLLGKPADARHAAQMLARLRGRTHRVVTALALADRQSQVELVDACATDVPMRTYSDDEIRAYVADGSPLDKAGAYGIQDRDLQPVAVERLDGCYANVMGLPLCHLVRTMRRLGHVPPADVPAACMAETGYDCPVYPQILAEEV